MVAGAADVASCMDEFYACMARVRRVEETQPEARLRALEGLVGAQDLAEACRDFVLNRFTAAAVRRLGSTRFSPLAFTPTTFPARGRTSPLPSA